MIRTKSITDPVEAQDGQRIFVSSYLPKHTEVQFDLWFPELGSDLELIKNWEGRRFDWEYFKRDYLDRLEQPRVHMVLDRLAQTAENETVTLLGHAKKSNQCHRTLLKEYLDTHFIYKPK